ncbi:hypothetical protein F4777DRAFT_393822 [Nemania sp. FL0916]|nr:hypothetical protein F4777DRAFT_393822 [Nemania sp. FL0916]
MRWQTGVMDIMNTLTHSQKRAVEQFQALFRDNNDARQKALQLIVQSESSVQRPSLTSASGLSCIPEPVPEPEPQSYADAPGDFRMPNLPVSQNVFLENASMPLRPSGEPQNCWHLVPRNTPPHQRGDQPYPHAPKRLRTMSQRAPSSQKMDRGMSNMSTMSAGPFTGRTPVSPLSAFRSNGVHDERSGQDAYPIENGLAQAHSQIQSQSQCQSQSFAHSASQVSAEEQHCDLPAFPGPSPFATTGRLQDPGAFFATHEEPLFDSVPLQRDLSMSGYESMVSTSTWDASPAMTRDNSQFGSPSGLGGIPMVNISSQTSQGLGAYFSEPTHYGVEYGGALSSPGKFSPHEDDLLGAGSSLAGLAPPHYAAAAAAAAVSDDGLLGSLDMERSGSTASITSTKSVSLSLNARAKNTLRQQNCRAQTAPLKPKLPTDEDKKEAPSSEKIDGKAAISKTKYVRQKQPKVRCDLCGEGGAEFRGDHELRRHRDAKHKNLVKKYICVDPQVLGLPYSVQVVNPLSACKQCKQRKQYGAYYNAAAHLRRTHFKPKPSRAKNRGAGSTSDEGDKRGGKGGGNWPNMAELKNWMQEVEVPRSHGEQQDDQQDEQSPSDDEDASDEMDTDQTSFGHAELNSHMVGHVSPGSVASTVVGLDFGYTNGLAINTGIPYMPSMPISSADFTVNTPTAMPLAFQVYPTMDDHMHQVAAPSNIFDNEQHSHFGEIDYQYGHSS